MLRKLCVGAVATIEARLEAQQRSNAAEAIRLGAEEAKCKAEEERQQHEEQKRQEDAKLAEVMALKQARMLASSASNTNLRRRSRRTPMRKRPPELTLTMPAMTTAVIPLLRINL